MLISDSIKTCLNKSVLCWLATCSSDFKPNVSPKEIFTHIDDEYIIVANIASPKTIKNLKSNSNICISVIDILVQKGYQLKGTAEIIDQNNPSFERLKAPLFAMAGERFPFPSIIKMKLESSKKILAPSYILYPDTTTEENQIASAKKIYGLSE